MSESTIAAISTAPGEAGIAIVRLTGENSINIIEDIFKPTKGKKIRDYSDRRLTHGYIIDPHTSQAIDEVLVTYMKAPYTYTAEDVVEINCHGGIVPVKKILELVLKRGAVLAEPGEFTKRAFLNGRIDLSQAEAVIDMIKAKTENGFKLAFSQLEGSLSLKIMEIRNTILEMMAHITVNIDFPDDDIEELTYDELEKRALAIHESILNLLKTADTGRIIKEGLNTVIVGKPNVGKSSLMNALLREARAIVTEIPGTTRDTIEEFVSIQGIPIKIIDTAGIRETEDLVEKVGIERSKEIFNKADLIIFVLNASEPLSHEDEVIMKLLINRPAIILMNKTDLPIKLEEKYILKSLPDKKLIKVSIIEGTGLDKLEEAIVDLVYGGLVINKESSLVTNVRHKNALEKAEKAMRDALSAIKNNLSMDFLEVDVKNCWEELGEIIGETMGEDVLDKIFSKFCIGK
ncbi:MAG: tRNA uridine-5-carboxymethylaminomethyl(34) synthesis GTPase MnmE [Alkaliphilus sp.]|nr:tRNA uridine-5-carboxymethylaminomethyl(34) synthesis GTPase MnmE [Alkaliphilus sp.]